jgi:putative addiction module killer protein
MVYRIVKSELYLRWFRSLRDRKTQAIVLRRIDRFEAGNPGDVKAVGGGVSELRIDYGPGYRIYFTQIDGVTYLLLSGGDKRSQQRDIQTAIELAKDLRQ